MKHTSKINGIGAREWFERESAAGSFTGRSAVATTDVDRTERPVCICDRFIDGGWHVVAKWADGSVTMHGRYEVYPTRENGKEVAL